MKTGGKILVGIGMFLGFILVAIALILVITFSYTSAWAGDKEEAELKLQGFNLQAQNIGLQKQLLIKDLDQWKKLDEQMAELNKQVQVFQKDLAAKGLVVNEQGKVIPKPKEKGEKP